MPTCALWLLTAALIAQAPAGTERTPLGRRVGLNDDATLFVPNGYKAGEGGTVDVLVHLHGAASVVEPALMDSGCPAVLVEFNRKGLSGVYTRPFQERALLPRLVDSALKALKALGVVESPKQGRLVVSAFSAGFGGVREMLKVPEHFGRIDGVILADSLYCGYTGDPAQHEVDPALMEGFRRFALEAAAGRKTMLVTHSALVPEGYAGTAETADFLARAVGSRFENDRVPWDSDWTQTRKSMKGRLLILGFEGKEGVDHMKHLRRIGLLWRRFLALPGGAEPPGR